MQRRRRKQPDPLPDLPPCDWEGCGRAAAFRAPRDRHSIGSNRPESYYHFCDLHIVQYNRNWDYFQGMSQPEIDAFRHDALTGHKPTWSHEARKTTRRQFSLDDLDEALRRFEGFSHPRAQKEAMGRILTEGQKEAFAVLDLEHHASKDDIRLRYKTLVKQLHPDVNNGSKTSEERFKRVAEAYRTLRDLA